MKTYERVKIDVTHSVWPWIAEQAGFLLTRFEVSRDSTNGVQATDRKIRKGARFVIRRRNLVEAGGPRGKLTGMWEDGLYFGIKTTTEEVIVGVDGTDKTKKLVAFGARVNKEEMEEERESARQEAEERAAEARHDLADLQKSEGKRERGWTPDDAKPRSA